MDKVAATNIMSRVFIATGFTYFIIGTTLITAKLLGAISIDNDPIFLMDLYGFVTLMIFGLSYIFVPGLSRTRFASPKIIILEYVLLNAGIVLIESVLMLKLGGPVALVAGASALIAAVLLHVFNMLRIMLFKDAKPAGVRNNASD
ncbi:MAG: hypothetical protein M1474_02615 [Candidatus Marsarchaeota archaeon]|jgi:hypothetical protein|nr:hypothetical protein [Candidatus Marsarchaeota archaeon]